MRITRNVALMVLSNATLRFRGFKYLIEMRRLHNEGAAYTSQWLNYHKDYPDLYPAPDIHKQTAFDDAVKCKLALEDGKIFFTLDIHEADNLWGTVHSSKVSTYQMELSSTIPDIFHRIFKNAIVESAEEIIIQQDKKAYNLRIAAQVKKMLLSAK